MAQPVDGKTYYGYLFQTDKKPTKVLDALLRGIANYITESVGSKEEKCLTPAKLASFYKAVGGNYDSLFVEVPHPSISWIYASIGCQHTLQPSPDDFTPPSIPALTPRGFARWQSIEILLGPEEHVPFIQNAVRNFALTHPETGEPFPVDLPTDAFPAEPDVEIEKWHQSCAEKLRQRATPNEEEPPPDLPPRPKAQGYAHVRPGRPRTEMDYFEPKSRGTTRPIAYQHVSSVDTRPVRPRLSRSPSHRARQFLAPEDTAEPRLARSRRRSFPDNLASSPEIVNPPNASLPQPDLRPHVAPEHVRRHSHSHPRHLHRYSVSSDASSSSEGETPSPTHVDIDTTPRRRSHPHQHSDRDHGGPKIRFAGPPTTATVPPPPPPDPRIRRRERDRSREDESKRRSFPIPIDLNGKLSAPFLLGKKNKGDSDREHGSRSNSRGGGGNNVRWKDLYNIDAGEERRRTPRVSDEDVDPGMPSMSRRHSREERDRVTGGRGDFKRREREREREREWRPSKGHGHERRSSHEDPGGRRERDRERRYRDRDREGSPTRGVDGRRYPPGHG